MNLINKHLNKNNLHHAYLIEGDRKTIEMEIVQFIKELGINTSGNADFSHIIVDSFKIEDARNLRAFSAEKGISTEKRFFLISTNNFLLEAQNSLLKMFEEPIKNTHFFLVVPDAGVLLKTFVSRFYLISTQSDPAEQFQEIEKFISMPLNLRINFIKELLTEIEENEIEIVSLDSTRSKALKFLNRLEQVLERKLLRDSAVQNFPVNCFQHFFKVRKYLNQPGSSLKNLMESVAIAVPNF